MTSCIRPSLVLDSLPELKVRSLPPVSPDFDGCLGSAFGNCRATAVGATAAAEAAAVFRNIRRSSPDILLSGLLCSTQTCSLTSASEERAQPSFAPAAGQPARVQNGCTRNPIQDHTAQADHAAAQRAPFRMSEPGECLHERSWLRKFHDAVQQQKQYGHGAQDASRPECLLRDRSDLRRLQQCCAFRSFPFHSRINRCLKSPFRTVFQHPALPYTRMRRVKRLVGFAPDDDHRHRPQTWATAESSPVLATVAGLPPALLRDSPPCS